MAIIPSVFTGPRLAALVIAVCFAAGVNVYGTVLMLGLLARTHALALPAQLQLVQRWDVLVICGLLFAAEFIGDKIPVFDLLWNAAQTFVRVPVAALLAYGAAQHLGEGPQLLAALAGGSIAFAAHGGKFAARAAVSHSPEPFSNSALSLSEDALVAWLTWFATRHPYAAAMVALGLVAFALVMIRYVIRAMRRVVLRLAGLVQKKAIRGDKVSAA